jgi:hypothetical protein
MKTVLTTLGALSVAFAMALTTMGAFAQTAYADGTTCQSDSDCNPGEHCGARPGGQAYSYCVPGGRQSHGVCYNNGDCPGGQHCQHNPDAANNGGFCENDDGSDDDSSNNDSSNDDSSSDDSSQDDNQ